VRAAHENFARMKILIILKNWIGDALFQIPAIEALRAQFPSAEIVCMAPARCLEVLREHPAVDRLVLFDERGPQRWLWKKAAVILWLRREKFDRGYLFHRSKTRALLLMLGGVRERIGFQKGRRFFLTRAYKEPPETLHHADQMLALLRQDGLNVPERGIYRFYYSPESRRNVVDFLDRQKLPEGTFACFHLGANWEPKRWPAERFAALAEKLHAHYGLAIVVTGQPADEALFQAMKTQTRQARLVSLVGQTTLQELAALFRRAAVLVTGDSGPMHIAAGAGARVVALFGPTDAARTGPRGPGETEVIQYIPEGYRVPWYGPLPKEGWLEHVTPDQVLAVIERRGWGAGLPPTPEPLCRKKPLMQGERPVRSILFVTLTNLGDVILNTAVLAKLLGRYPEARVTAVVSPRGRSILEKSPQIQRLVIYDKRASLFEKLRFVRELRRESYDLAMDLRNSAIPFLAGARRSSPLIRRYKSRSMRARHLEVLTMMGIPGGLERPFDFFRPADQQSLEKKLENAGVPAEHRLVVMAPVAASELKTWKLQGYGEVIRGLLAQEDLTILLAGDKRERELAAPLTALHPARVLNLAGQTSMPEAAALLKKASLVVANDSSIMHLAHELGVPTVAVYGPTDHVHSAYTDRFFKVVRAGSPCSPCNVPRCRYDRQHCFEDLNPADVLRACEELLHDYAPARG